MFVSNNSTKSRKGYVKKFQSLGLPWVTADQVIPSSFAAAYYLAQNKLVKQGESVYVIGEEGLCEELQELGISWLGGKHDRNKPWTEDDPKQMAHQLKGDNVSAVLVGSDRQINYRKLAKAHYYIRYQNAKFFATNDDSTFPDSDLLFPGNGSIVAALKTASDIEPKVFGKPHAEMMEAIVSCFHLNPARTCMVGDRLNTDIQFGHNGGMHTLCVLTGVTTLEEVESDSQTVKPDFYIGSLVDLYSLSIN